MFKFTCSLVETKHSRTTSDSKRHQKIVQRRKMKQHRTSTINHSNLTVLHPQFNEVLWVTPPDLYKQWETWEFGCDLWCYGEQLKKIFSLCVRFIATVTTGDATTALTQCHNLYEMYEQCQHGTTVCSTFMIETRDYRLRSLNKLNFNN